MAAVTTKSLAISWAQDSSQCLTLLAALAWANHKTLGALVSLPVKRRYSPNRPTASITPADLGVQFIAVHHRDPGDPQ